MTNASQKTKHPIGLQLVNLVTIIQNFYAYGIIGFLVLFFTATVSENGLGLDKAYAVQLFGYYSSLGYLMGIVGGWVADRFLGLQKSIIISTLFSCAGYICLYYSTSELWTIYMSLAILLLAAGIGKGNISALVGALYDRDQLSMKDAAYSIFYMAINIGALLGPIIFGLITDEWFAKVGTDGKILSYGYRYGFLLAAAMSFVQFLVFLLLAPKMLGERGKYPATNKKTNKVVKAITKIDIDRMIAMGILFIFSVLFWSAWNQTLTSFTILIQKGVDRTILGWTVPTPWIGSFNGLLCAILAPLLGMLWVRLSKTKRGDFDTGTKMGVGMILSGLAFGIMLLGISSVNGDVESGKMNIMYILVAYVVLTVGELFLSPIGMAMFNKIAPAKYASIAMGVWYVSFSLAHLISGELAALTVKLSYNQVFMYIGIVVIVFGIILLLIKGFLNKLMHLELLEDE